MRRFSCWPSTSRRLEICAGATRYLALWALLWRGWSFQSFGALLVGHVLKNATAVNAVFGLVLGLAVWLYVAAATLVVCVEVNVVRAKRLWPRALMTPFTDDVDLTRGDRRSYSDAAKAQRLKGFENVEVTFDNEGQNATTARQTGKAPGLVQREDEAQHRCTNSDFVS